jgi:hypothetical protein
MYQNSESNPADLHAKAAYAHAAAAHEHSTGDYASAQEGFGVLLGGLEADRRDYEGHAEVDPGLGAGLGD